MNLDRNIFALRGKSYIFSYPCPNTTICAPYALSFFPGTYKIELWGAGTSAGGGFVSGVIHLLRKTKFFLYIGGVSQSGLSSGIGGFNGGGNSTHIGIFGNGIGQRGGDGATDLRYDINDLNTRIIVAGGAGGGNTRYPGGYGGGFEGGNGTASDKSGECYIGYGGNQIEGGAGHVKGELGVGAISKPIIGTDLAGSGGGGYMGGGSGYHIENEGSGGGGSSYINGNINCKLMNTDYIFTHSFTIPGNTTMYLPNGTKSVGNIGNGYAKITCIFTNMTCGRSFRSGYSLSLLIVQLIIST